MPHRRREEKGIVDVVIGPGEQAPKPFEGFDLGKIAVADAELLSLTFKYFDLNSKSQSDRKQLRRILSKKAGRTSDHVALLVELIKAGMTNNTATAAARKIAAHRKQVIKFESLVQKNSAAPAEANGSAAPT